MRFVGAANQADDAYATKRLREALALAGITNVHFEFEPVAAAYLYEAWARTNCCWLRTSGAAPRTSQRSASVRTHAG